ASNTSIGFVIPTDATDNGIFPNLNYGSKLMDALRNSTRGSRRTATEIILYDYQCPDGAFVALAAHLYFMATSLLSLYFPNTVYRPLTPTIILSLKSSISTFSISLALLIFFTISPPKFKGNENLGAENVYKVIVMKGSGATIVLDYFKEKLMNHDVVKHQSMLDEFERVQQLYWYIEDGRVRWRGRERRSKRVAEE
ncbi:hypothetical protein HN51_001543, partial [Arachis hypogaea]